MAPAVEASASTSIDTVDSNTLNREEKKMVSNSHDRPVRPVARINTGKRANAPLDTLLWAALKQYAVDHDRNMHVLVDEVFSQWLESVGYLEPFDQEGAQ